MSEREWNYANRNEDSLKSKQSKNIKLSGPAMTVLLMASNYCLKNRALGFPGSYKKIIFRAKVHVFVVFVEDHPLVFGGDVILIISGQIIATETRPGPPTGS